MPFDATLKLLGGIYVKQRNIGLCIVLSVVTCGIYWVYWYMCVTDEANLISGIPDTGGLTSVIFSLLSCGLYDFYWAYRIGEKLDALRNGNGFPSGNFPLLLLGIELGGFVLYTFAYALIGFGAATLSCYGLITMSIIQSELNRYAQY